MRNWAVIGVLALSTVVAMAGEAGKGSEGFFISDDDGLFTLNAEFLLQLQGTYLEEEVALAGDLYSGSANTDLDPRSDFLVRRARAAFFGSAFSPWLHFRFELESSTDHDSLELLDAYIAMEFSEANNWKFGQFRTPFDLFEMIESKYQMFVERPVGTAGIDFRADGLSDIHALAPSRDIGLMYSGHTKSERIHWKIAVQNGNGRNQTSNDNNDFMTTLRLEFQNEGGFSYKATAAHHPERTEYTFGAAVTGNSVNNPMFGDGLIDLEFGGECFVGVSRSCGYVTADNDALEVFGALRTRAFQINASWQAWTFEQQALNASGTLTDLDQTYWNVDFGGFVSDKRELAGRYGVIEFDDPVDITHMPGAADLKLTDREVSEWRAGVNHYFSEHNFKLMIDYGEVTVEDDELLIIEDSPLDATTELGKREETSSGLRVMLAFFI
ncbi:MAG: hypothetical protein JSV80_09250 [Acidobacteriota bacterium]|nr:MAG: hypothetical protein JSV80_09250 [Acidobacteriota bacterium]